MASGAAYQIPLHHGSETHDVRNQVAPAVGFNAFSDDVVLRAAIARHAPWATDKAAALGALVGNADVQDAARLANDIVPVLRTHDRNGHRTDWVEFHPAWHQLMALAFGHEVHSLAWTSPHPSAHFARAVQSYLWNQVENGIACPTGMAYAACAGFAERPEFALWREKTLSTTYDARRIPLEQKTGAVIGYAMTEKQGGSDLRETQTTGEYAGTDGDATLYRLTGHKWFFSVPVADGFYTLAQTTTGVSCFFVPRLLPDGTLNPLAIQRLKDKCGNRSNASSEIEFRNTIALLVGDEGRGIREILSHAHLTRLDFAVGSAGLMRHALTLAVHHATSRTGFGRRMSQLPMQENVLADLALESEAAALSALRVARAADGMAGDSAERLLARIMTPVVKFWNCQRASAFVYEALQVHGGNGFIMEHPVARLYREAPLNSIWEGTSNMMCMDVLRVLSREPGSAEAFMHEVHRGGTTGHDHTRFLDALRTDLSSASTDEGHARALTTRMALALQASELLQFAPDTASHRFVESRIGGQHAGVFGTLRPGRDLSTIVERSAVTSH
jgi:putative acyl-CoA dehydrogenase